MCVVGRGPSLEVPLLPLEEVRVSTALVLALVEMPLEFREVREELRLESVKYTTNGHHSSTFVF